MIEAKTSGLEASFEGNKPDCVRGMVTAGNLLVRVEVTE
jgi:hypothetical protein